MTATNTKHKIGKITYIISATHSESTSKTIEEKIEKLITRDLIAQEYATNTNIEKSKMNKQAR